MSTQTSKIDISKLQTTLYQNFSLQQLELLAIAAERSGLDPFARQIYATKRWDSTLGIDKINIQVSIDGFRLVAERSGKYAGQVGPFWHNGNEWVDYWIDSTPPVAAKVGVIRSDFKEIMWGFARFDAYKQTNKSGQLTMIWKNMPELMIAKCAEALALRKAFPQELSGFYTDDELPPQLEEKAIDEEPKEEKKKPIAPKPDYTQAKVSITEKIEAKQPATISASPTEVLHEASKANGWSGAQMRIVMQFLHKKNLIRDLTDAEVKSLAELMQSKTFAEVENEWKQVK